MNAQTPPPRPQNGIAQLVHFAAAQELKQYGGLTPETARLLVLSAPQAISGIDAKCEHPGQMRVHTVIEGAGRRFSGEWFIDAKENLKTNGSLYQETLANGTMAVVEQIKVSVLAIWQAKMDEVSNLFKPKKV